MTTFGIRDPRIAAGFSALSNAMFPSAMDQVRASVLGAQREMINSRAGLYGAQAADINLDMEGRRRMSDIVASNGVDFSQQHNRQSLISGAMLRNNQQQAVAGGAAGMGVVNPNMPDLSQILTAGGVQTFQNTPQGFAETNARLAQQGDLDRASRETIARGNNQSAERIAAMPDATGADAGADARRPLSLQDTRHTRDAIRSILTSRYNEANGTNVTVDDLKISDDLLNTANIAAEREIRRLGNPTEGIVTALNQLNVDFSPDRGWFSTTARARLRPGGANPAPSGGGGTGAVGAAQAAPAATQAPKYREGEVRQNPATGERIVLRNNQWVPMQ